MLWDLVSRFRIFERPTSVSLEKTDAIVRTSCALHNWLRSTSAYITTDLIDVERSQICMLNFEIQNGGQYGGELLKVD
ncbi:hypothetical protein NQ317_016843 [Molorchus minor]|uniref:DDE Tnp4 domain-containing protein n=1 Tax=Molorchus minor TaxID=1323400 RepID=A0ABQ9JIU9_9CUCU|nr:hypothetical protein NQ317_016843 [Molorchus minor]